LDTFGQQFGSESMKIAGILNVTEDSFSDGSLYLDTQSAIDHADKLIKNGADVIDIGAQSSNINAKLISDEAEWGRILPIVEYLQNKKIPISIDSFKPNVIQKAILQKVDYINNINAFQEPEILEVLSNSKPYLPELILMFSHSRGGIARLGSSLGVENIIDEISKFFDERISDLHSIGVPFEKLIFDPGMGFFLGENPELSIKVLSEIQTLKKRYPRLYVSVSRKSFLGNLLGGIPPSERENATLAAEIYLFQSKIEWIRTHEPLKIKQSMIILNKIYREIEK
jgi:dihydropteroate synthase